MSPDSTGRPRPTRVAGLVVMMVLAAGCAGGDEQAGSASPSAVTEPGTAAAETPTGGAEQATASPTQSPTADPATAPIAPESPSPTGPVEITRSTIATGLQAPWGLAFTPDGTVYVTERDTGRLLSISPEGEITEVQTFPVDATGEGGLMGLAVPPDYAENGSLYVYYTSRSDNRIVRFQRGEEPEPVLTGIPKASIHDGGRIAFGPDGMLYAGTGDAGQSSRAQDPDSLGGKILRMTPQGEPPEDNPTSGSLVYSMGHRNVQGLAWDSDGQLYASEFGPDRDDELNRIQAGGNYGWPQVTGRADGERFIDPIAVRQPNQASWTGSTVLTDSAIPQWNGSLLAASLRGERLWRFELSDDGRVSGDEQLLVDELGRLRLTAQAPDGSLWVFTNNRDGRGDPGPRDDRIIRLGP